MHCNHICHHKGASAMQMPISQKLNGIIEVFWVETSSDCKPFIFTLVISLQKRYYVIGNASICAETIRFIISMQTSKTGKYVMWAFSSLLRQKKVVVLVICQKHIFNYWMDEGRAIKIYFWLRILLHFAAFNIELVFVR